MVTPRLITYSGVVASGKTFLLEKSLEQLDPNTFTRSVSTTTRAPREGEVEGKDYFFTDKPTFEAKQQQNEFFEYTFNPANQAYYGTSKAAVAKSLAQGQAVLRNADYAGASAAKTSLGEQAVNVFILPPPFLNVDKQLATLAQRLEKRSPHMPTEEKQARLQQAREEITRFYKNPNPFDYLVINPNGDLQTTLSKLKEIAYKGTSNTQPHKHIYPYEASPLYNVLYRLKQVFWDVTHPTSKTEVKEAKHSPTHVTAAPLL